jgi:hypothetical protein
MGHLLAGGSAGPEDFQRGSKKQPLRATIASRSSGGRPKLAEATRHTAQAGPASLPNQFVPRAPIPTPEVLAAKKAAMKSSSGGKSHSSSTVKCSAERAERAERADHRAERSDHRAERADHRAERADHRTERAERAAERAAEHAEHLESKNQQIYQSPRDRDGDYSYAYDCSISPAVVIKWGEDSADEDEEPIKVKNENIYEEIQEVRQDSSSGSNTDSGIGVPFCNSSAGSSSMPCSKGTLDVKKKVQSQHQNHNNHKPPREPVKPMSSLDALLCQTTLTADQRNDLRKSLVDELFEELIQRHHKRVLDELKLDVEEFIAPPPEQLSVSGDSLGTPKSSRSKFSRENDFTEKSSGNNFGGLTRCESMDFKNKQQETTTTTTNNTNNNNHSSDHEKTRETNVRLGSKLWQSARKCSEVIQRKWNRKKSSPNAPTTSSSSPEVVNHRTRPEMTGNFREKSSNDVEDWPQVSRRGRRPLSAIVSHNHAKHSNFGGNNNSVLARNSNHVIHHQDLEDEADSDSEEVEARRLLRSQIIKSFWEQHDLENQEQVPGSAISAEEDNVS